MLKPKSECGVEDVEGREARAFRADRDERGYTQVEGGVITPVLPGHTSSLR